MTEEFFLKVHYTIKDLAKIVKKETNTIRSWENKGIIRKPNKSSNNWRHYSREDMALALEMILSYPWDRNVIKNKTEIEYAIDRLRGRSTTRYIVSTEHE